MNLLYYQNSWRSRSVWHTLFFRRRVIRLTSPLACFLVPLLLISLSISPDGAFSVVQKALVCLSVCVSVRVLSFSFQKAPIVTLNPQRHWVGPSHLFIMGCSPRRCLALITQLSGSTARGAIGDILLIVRSVPLSHVWPGCRQEREDLRTLVSPTSVLLCNSLTQRRSMSVTHRMRKCVTPPPKFKLPYNGGSETQGHFKPDVAQVGRCAARLSKARQPSKKPTRLTDVKVILLAKPRTPIGVTGDSKNKVQCDDRDRGPVGTLAGARY